MPRDSGALVNYYMDLAFRIENHINTTRLPSLLISLALSVFAAGATLRVYDDAWFRGAEFVGFALFATALLAAGVAVHIAELSLPRKDKRASIAGQNGSAAQARDHQAAGTGPGQANGEPVTESPEVSEGDPAPKPTPAS
jgi:hypothetical protein